MPFLIACMGMPLALKALLLEALPLKMLVFTSGLSLFGGAFLFARMAASPGRVDDAKCPTESIGMLDSMATHGSSGLSCILRPESGGGAPRSVVALVTLVAMVPLVPLVAISGAGSMAMLALEGSKSWTASLVLRGTMRRTFTSTFTVFAVSAGLVRAEVSEALVMAATDRVISARMLEAQPPSVASTPPLAAHCTD